MRQGKFLIPGVGPTTRVGDAATAILVAKSRHMFDLEAAASGGADMDAVHDMRVASRRTREALSALSPAFKDKVEGELISIAKTVTRSLGAVRDADVFLAEFTEMASSTEDADQRIALAYLIGRRQAERVAALDKMRKRLGRLDLKQSRKRFRKVAKDTRGGADSQRLVDLAREVLNDRVDLVYMHLPAALDEENAHEQHSMRIAFKHLRYAVETFAPCFDGSFSRIHDTLVAFQNVLGEMHDLDVFAEAVSRTLDRDEAIAAGVTRAGVDEILAELAAQRAGRYRRFKRFVLQHPEERTRQRILGSLIEPPDDTLVEDAATPAEPTVAEDVHPIPLGKGTALVEPEPSREAGDGGGPTETIGEDPA